ncbi:MAG: hypothetical protein M0D55_13395 [Elusimicrobiota bacterium]|nr:MAG: hypothetical protein M0D55_13395 [Elusimicrobiota bacterium]
MRKLLRRRGLARVDALTLGGTRLGGAAGRRELTRLLRPLAARPLVVPDFQIAHAAAFGKGPGVLLVASTGSIAYARGTKGAARRAGGLGPLLGDEGSGFWLGRRLPATRRCAARFACPARSTSRTRRIPSARRPRSRRASCVPPPRARRLRESAADHLATLAAEAVSGLALPKPVPLALHGSLFKDPGLRAAVLRRLGRVRLVAPRLPAERAAAGL